MSQATTPESREGLRNPDLRGNFLDLDPVQRRMRILDFARAEMRTQTQGPVDRAQAAIRAEAERAVREQDKVKVEQLEHEANVVAPAPVPGSHDVEQIRAFIRDYPTPVPSQGE